MTLMGTWRNETPENHQSTNTLTALGGHSLRTDTVVPLTTPSILAGTASTCLITVAVKSPYLQHQRFSTSAEHPTTKKAPPITSVPISRVASECALCATLVVHKGAI